MDSLKKPLEDGPVLVSACLLGLPTRYDGGDCRRRELLDALAGSWLVPVCPEQLGGLPTPRAESEFDCGSGEDVLDGRARLVSSRGDDVTDCFLRGAWAAAELARLLGVRRALLKEGSPSCGVRRVWRAGRVVEGCGVAAALLRRLGVEIEGIE